MDDKSCETCEYDYYNGCKEIRCRDCPMDDEFGYCKIGGRKEFVKMDEQKKKKINRNINILTRSLFDAGLPLYKVTEIARFIHNEIMKHEEGENNEVN